MSTFKTERRKGEPRAQYDFEVVTGTFEMPDGVKLASTTYLPVSKRNGEKFPVLLEVLPYRKDDTFYISDYPSYSYFARHGFITVKIDIRGTGGSTGVVPPREYSDVELDDIEEVIRQLSELPESNGSIGMWGVSWSGFNSLQVAMRRPPALKALLVMHSSDDLYQDDLHYIDGALHLDPYHLFINHELGLPRTPDYVIDRTYFKSRFEREPWLFTYLSKQEDGDFWRRKSLMEDYSAINIPVYAIGGLWDGYRDTVIRLLENLESPVKAEIGPYEHSCPDEGSPGPNYEWHREAVRWFAHWLAGVDNGVDEEVSQKRLSVFVRDSGGSDRTPGKWRMAPWPLRNADCQRYFLGENGKLLARSPKQPGNVRLSSSPGSGTAAGHWWGDVTGDQSADDADSVVFDKLVKTKTEIVGFVKVNLLVSTNSPKTNWSIRLEDVAPDGFVSLVTGKVVNGSHLSGRLTPSLLPLGEPIEVEVLLHFTSWTFRPGHKIRLAISNSQFPIAWPSPAPIESSVLTGSRLSSLELPVISGRWRGKPTFKDKIDRKLDCPDGEYIDLADNQPEFEKRTTRDETAGVTCFESNSRSGYKIRRRKFVVVGKNRWTTNDKKPSESSYVGEMTTKIGSSQRKVRLRTVIEVESDVADFKVCVRRELYISNRRVKRKTWRKSIPRRHH